MKSKFNRKKTQSFTKLNLIPILDSVFIFIFFLLFSTKFINFTKLSIEVPNQEKGTQTHNEPKDKKRHLQLLLNSPNEIVGIIDKEASPLFKIKISKQGNLENSFNSEYEKFLRMEIIHDDYIQIKANTKIEYFIIVKLIDQINISNKSLNQNKRIVITKI